MSENETKGRSGAEKGQRAKEPGPKSLREVPGYLKRLLSGFFYRLFYILKLVWEAKKSLLILMVFMALFNGVSPVISAYISANLLNRIADVITAGPDFEFFVAALLPALLLKFGFMFFTNLVQAVSHMITRTSSEVVTNHIKVKIMNKAKEVDLASFDMPEFYEKLENANREVGTRPVQVIQSTFRIISTLISAVSFIVILTAISWVAPMIVIVLSIPSAIITFIYRKKNYQYMRRRSKDRRQMAYYSNTLVNKDLVKELRLFDLSDTFVGKYNEAFGSYYKGMKRLITQEGFWNIGITLVTTAVNCGLFFYIAYDVAFNGGSIGDYSLYTGALNSIASCISTLVTTTSSIYEGTLFIDNMIVFMNEKSHIVPSVEEPLHVSRGVGHTIEFQNVSFRYPGTDRDVLKNINLVIKPEETVVMVGLNGAGKTTLLKLLTRLYDPTGGVILLDGEDIKKYDIQELYAMFGIVFQDFGKYAFSAQDNIAFGQIKKPIAKEEIREAAVASSADEFIEALPRGYETPLMRVFEAEGIELSIGQWQKLSIARAFYSDSDVLILDEPTASVDAIAEQEIYETFDKLRKDKTTFFVSHRLSCATIATKVLVLDNGELAEVGSHEELMRKKGIYHKLFTTQADRYLV